jgi:hypothetical protein
MERVEFRGTVEKVSTFSSKGGGLELKVQTPHDGEIGAVLLDNVQRPATITVVFHDETAEIDDDQPDLLGDE